MKTRILIMAAMVSIGGAGCTETVLPPGPASSAAPKVTAYKLGVGDKINVSTFGEETLSGDFTVSPGGTITMPLVGDIPVSGHTSQEVQAAIENGLRSGGYLQSPQVSVNILTFRPYYVLGEVTKPGEYPYSTGMTVTKAIAAASGYTYRANQHFVYIVRDGQSAEQKIEVTAATPIGPGDQIRIGERSF